MAAEYILSIGFGKLKGLVKKSVRNSNTYYAFKGIPYAEPPVGENRFKDPKPWYQNWDGVRDATDHGSVCSQPSEFIPKTFIGGEDCLFLNVYTPKIPNVGVSSNGSDEKLLPVMFYIHGGAFTFGSGDDSIAGPDYFMESGVVLLTINYRLGALGFLCLGNEDVPGNAGLKDQQVALMWTRENIKYFGGDPDNITIFGNSAGGASVHYQTLSPKSSGLFHKAILQSGSALCSWGYVNHETAIRRAFKLGEVLGFKTENAEDLAKFLRNQPYEDLARNQTKILSTDERKQLLFPFVPCKEVPYASVNNFLVEDPEVLLKAKKYAKIPYILGICGLEGLILLKENPKFLSNLDSVTSEALNLLPNDLSKISNPQKVFDLTEKVKNFYLKQLPLTVNNYEQYIDLYGDIYFYIPINKVINYLVSDPNVPVYLYHFTFEGKLNVVKKFVQMSTTAELPKGVCHADELGYLFYVSLLGDELPVDKDSKEMDIVDTFITFWTNFAISGNPSDDKYSVKWERCQPSKLCHIEINEPLKLVPSVISPEKSEFWQNIYDNVKLINKL